VYGYCRASPSEVEGVSDAQRAEIDKAYRDHFAGTHAWGGWFVDRGVPGEKPLRQRREGHRLSMALEAGDVVLFTRLDRGFRNLRDALGTIAAWGRRGVQVVLLVLAVGPGEPVREGVARLLAAVAEFERCRLSGRVNDHAAERRRQGRPVWGRHPYGLKTAGPRGKKRYVPDLYTRGIGAKIVQWHLAGWSFAAIYLHLSGLRVKTRRGTEWSEGTIKRAYYGELRLRQEDSKRAGCE
jgi:DNA invertase Pin-like site-specific DNA recombinase